MDDILQQFTALKDSVLRGVFKQQTARVWCGCRAEKAQVIVLLPGKCCYSTWSDLVGCMSVASDSSHIVPVLAGLVYDSEDSYVLAILL